MAAYSYPNAPQWPHEVPKKISQCCAKCRRGTKGFGLLPCGFKYQCPCHDKETQ